MSSISYHCISCSSEMATVDLFNQWRSGMKIANKKIWLTEWQIGNFDGTMTDSEASLILVKGASYAFAHNVTKIFMVEFDYLQDYTLSKSAYGNLVSKLKNFKSVNVNTEILGLNDKIDVGVYEFIKQDDSKVLIAWGSGTLTIGGTIISAIDIYGNVVNIENNIANLGETPLIIETR